MKYSIGISARILCLLPCLMFGGSYGMASSEPQGSVSNLIEQAHKDQQEYIDATLVALAYSLLQESDIIFMKALAARPLRLAEDSIDPCCKDNQAKDSDPPLDRAAIYHNMGQYYAELYQGLTALYGELNEHAYVQWGPLFSAFNNVLLRRKRIVNQAEQLELDPEFVIAQLDSNMIYFDKIVIDARSAISSGAYSGFIDKAIAPLRARLQPYLQQVPPVEHMLK